MMDVTFNFAGKVAVVTGGASGIGLATAKAFAEAGAAVIIADINKGAAEQCAARHPHQRDLPRHFGYAYGAGGGSGQPGTYEVHD